MKKAIIYSLIITGILVLAIWLLPGKKFVIEKAHAQQIIIGTITAYSASADETDSDPRIAANGKEVFEGGVANNCLKFGTKVEINGQIFEVNDRKNKRYSCEWFDVFIDSKKEALQFGIIKGQEIKILN